MSTSLNAEDCRTGDISVVGHRVEPAALCMASGESRLTQETPGTMSLSLWRLLCGGCL